MSVSFRARVAREIMNDPEYLKKLDKAKNVEELKAIMVEFCRKKGYKIKWVR